MEDYTYFLKLAGVTNKQKLEDGNTALNNLYSDRLTKIFTRIKQEVKTMKDNHTPNSNWGRAFRDMLAMLEKVEKEYEEKVY